MVAAATEAHAHHTVLLNGVRLHYVEAGNPTRGRKKLGVICGACGPSHTYGGKAGWGPIGAVTGFERVEDGVRQSVATIRNHPLIPDDVIVHGLIIHPETGKLDLLVDGYTR